MPFGSVNCGIVGGLVSILTGTGGEVAELPATSLQVAVAEPLAGCVCVTVAVTGPEPESAQVHVIVAGALLHPAALIGAMPCNCSVGAVVSMRIGPTDAFAVLPA